MLISTPTLNLLVKSSQTQIDSNKKFNVDNANLMIDLINQSRDKITKYFDDLLNAVLPINTSFSVNIDSRFGHDGFRVVVAHSDRYKNAYYESEKSPRKVLISTVYMYDRQTIDIATEPNKCEFEYGLAESMNQNETEKTCLAIAREFDYIVNELNLEVLNRMNDNVNVSNVDNERKREMINILQNYVNE